MVNDRSANESSTAVNRLPVKEISTVNNQITLDQSRDSEPCRLAGDVFSTMYGSPTFHGNIKALGIWSVS